MKLLEEKVNGLEKENRELAASAAEVAVQLGQAAIETDQFAGKAGTAAEGTKAQEVALADLREQIEGNSKSVSEINNLLSDLSKGQSLNADAATALILKYPELTSAIYKTADGWKFETDAVEILRKAKVQKAIDDLKSEKESAFITKVQTDERLKAYDIEAQAIRSLADLKARLNGVVARSPQEVADMQSNLNSMTGIRGILKAPFQMQLDSDKTKVDNKKEIEDIYSEYAKEMKVYDDKIKALGNLYTDKNFGVSSDSGKKNKGKSDADKAAEKAAAARKEAYSEDLENFRYIAERSEWTIDQQIDGYKRLGQRHKQYLLEDKDGMKQYVRDVQKLNDTRYQEDVENLERRTERMRQANKQEIEMVKASLDFYTKEQEKSYLRPAQQREVQKQIYDLSVQYNDLRYQNSEKWIDREISKLEMAGQSKIAILKMEYDAYVRMSNDRDRTAEQSFQLQKTFTRSVRH